MYLDDVVTVQVAGAWHELRAFLADPDEFDALAAYLRERDQVPYDEQDADDLDAWIAAATDDARSIIRATTGDVDAEVYDVPLGEAILSDLAQEARGLALADLVGAVEQITAGGDPVPDGEPLTDDSYPGDWSGLAVWAMGSETDGLGCRWVVDRADVPAAALEAWQDAGYAVDGRYGMVGDVTLSDLTLTDEQRQAVAAWTARKLGALS